MEYKVLISEGSFADREEARRILRGYGMQPFFCGRNGAEIIRRINELKPDAVLMTAVLREADGFEVLSRAREMDNAPKFVLIHSGSEYSDIDRAMELGASYCIELPADCHLLVSKLDNLRLRAELARLYGAGAEKKRGAEEDVAGLLHLLAVPAHVKGYRYLREAVSILLRSANAPCYVTKEIYPAVARRFGTTVSRVERAMRHAIEIAWDRGDVDVITECFGYTVSPSRGKPTNGEFIALVADAVRMKRAQ